MKKRFLKVSLFCLLAACMPATFTSCKDYDDDIEVINKQVGDLNTQLNTLSDALAANQSAAQSAAQAAADAMAAAQKAQEAADKASAEAQAAQKTGDEALAQAKAAEAAAAAAEAVAQNALAEAELAKQAAATAKAEAIEEVMKQVNDLIAAQKAATEEELSKLAGRIEGIESGLNTLSGRVDGVESDVDALEVKVDELAKYDEAVKIQLAALEEFKTLMEEKMSTLQSNYDELSKTVSELQNKLDNLDIPDYSETLSSLQSQITTNKENLAALTTRVEALEADLKTAQQEIKDLQDDLIVTNGEIEKIKEELEKLSTKISTEVSTAVSTLTTMLSNRLTSVTLLPTSYVDGIPTIDFGSAKYRAMEAAGGDYYSRPGKPEVHITNNETEVKYRVSPTGVTSNDIKMPSFVDEIASTRVGNEENALIKVAGYSIENGILTVKAGRANTNPLDDRLDGWTDGKVGSTDGKINIVALKVPVADKHIFENENAADAAVYSEYVRVTESTFTPFIALKSDPKKHLFDYMDLMTWTAVGANFEMDLLEEFSVQYESTLDLKTLVAGCATQVNKYDGEKIYYDHNSCRGMSIEDLKKYGLELEFAIADTKFLTKRDDSETNQQAFGKVSSDGIFTPSYNNEDHSVVTVGRTPIVRIILRDTRNNKVVDVKFVKVKITEKDIAPVYVNFDNRSMVLSCTESYNTDITWGEFTNLVLLNERINMSHDQFTKLYTKVSYTGEADVNWNSSSSESTTAVSISWNVADFGKFIETNQLQKEFPVTITFEDPNGLNPKIVLKVILVVNMPTERVKMAGRNTIFWENENTISVIPVQYGTPAAKETCTYNFPLWDVFNPEPTLVNFLAFGSCATWDMQFAQSGQPSGFKAIAVKDYYTIGNNSGAYAAYLNWESAPHSPFHESLASIGGKTNFILNKTAAGKDLLASGENVKLTFFAKYPTGDIEEVATYNLHIKKPLNFDKAEMTQSFTDGIINGSRVNVAETFQMEDFRGYIVREKAFNSTEEKYMYADKLYDYYEVKEPDWKPENARINIGRASNGNLEVGNYDTLLTEVPGMDLSLKEETNANGEKELVFYNNSGLNVLQGAEIYVDATIEYGWGTEEFTVAIPVKPGVQNARRK